MKILGYEAHPLANAFRLLEGAEFDELLADIKANGPIDKELWLYEGKLLDGRNRGRVYELLGIKPKFREYDGDSPAAFVLSRNRFRRHDNESQRAMAACRLATLQQGQRRRRGEDVTQSEAAAAMNIGERTVRAARQVLDSGTPELVAAVDRGDIAVSRAAELAEMPVDEQRAHVGADVASAPRRTRRPSSEEMTPAAAAAQLSKTIGHALEQLGATLERKSNSDDHIEMRIAYAGRVWVLDVLDEGMYQ